MKPRLKVVERPNVHGVTRGQLIEVTWMVHATTVSASLVTRDLHMGRSMMNNDLTRLYESTEEDLFYGVGFIQLTGAGPTPFIHIHYRD